MGGAAGGATHYPRRTPASGRDWGGLFRQFGGLLGQAQGLHRLRQFGPLVLRHAIATQAQGRLLAHTHLRCRLVGIQLDRVGHDGRIQGPPVIGVHG